MRVTFGEIKYLLYRSSFPPFCLWSEVFSDSFTYKRHALYHFGENLKQIGQRVQKILQIAR